MFVCKYHKLFVKVYHSLPIKYAWLSSFRPCNKMSGGFSLAGCVVTLLALTQPTFAAQTTIVTESVFQPLQRLTYSNGHIYVAGTDSLHKLDGATLNTLNTKLLNSTDFCDGVCRSRPATFHPIVTALGVYNDSQLMVCTTRYGQCSLINSVDLSTSSRSSENMVTDINDNANVVYLKAIFQHDSNAAPKSALWIMSSHSPNSVKALSIRDPDTFLPTFTAGSTLQTPGYSSILPYFRTPTQKTSYIYTFQDGQFRFYVKNSNGLAFVGGMCDNDARFNSLTELPLQCRSDGSSVTRKYLQAVYVSTAGSVLLSNLRLAGSAMPTDLFLYGVFADNATSTASSVCAFDIQSLLSQMKQVFTTCHIYGNTVDVMVGPTDLIATPGECRANAVSTSANNLHFTTVHCHVYHPAYM